MSKIRLAEPDDSKAVAALVDAAYQVYLPRLGRKPLPMLDDYAARIAAGEVHVLTEGTEILGLVVLVPEADELLLDNIAVAPSAQGFGHGRRLLAFVEQHARDLGFRSIRLFTNVLMTENQAIYARYGFVETDRSSEGNIHRVNMRKRLD